VQPGDELKRILAASLEVRLKPLEDLSLRAFEQEEGQDSPRFPSGILAVQNLSGGFYAFTAISGKKKLGKTRIGVRCGLEAAQTEEWLVNYYYGENTGGALKGMVRGVLGEERSIDLPEWMELWRASRFSPGASVETLVESTSRHIPPSQERLLIIVDSGNRLARYTGRSKTHRLDYFRALERICQVAQTSSEESGGAIGWLILSETNQRGGMVGLDIEHSAGCLLYLRATRDPDKVRMKLESRESPGGELGVLRRKWETCEFVNDLAVAKEDDEEDVKLELPF
jgi:hypothetical protein